MSEICPLCESRKTTIVADRVRFDHEAHVRRCGECSLVFLDQDSFEFPADFYEHSYHQTYLTHVDPATVDPARYFEKMSIASKPWIERIRGLLTGAEAVLDVGCSTGHVLAGIRDAARSVSGHELSRKEVAYCRDVLQLDVADSPLEQRFAPGTFDYILLIFVLEHIGRPVEFLNDLKRYLKPDGKFVIVVPNVTDPLLGFYRIPEFGRFYFCIEHLFYYSPKTIGELFTRAALFGSIETVQEYPITNHLNWGYRQKPSETLASRRMVPDIALADESKLGAWERFWAEVNESYRQLLKREGHGDRVWSVVGRAR